jgi:putative MATE family efflux protein
MLLVLARLLLGMPIGTAPRYMRVAFRWRLDRHLVRQLLGLALPTIGEQWTFQFGLFIFAHMLVSQGTVTYAAHNSVVSIDSISFLPGIGLGIANTVLVGQSLGAGKPDQARLYAMTAYKMGLVFMSLMGLFFFLVPEFFLSLLIGNQEVVKAAVPALRIAGLFDPAIGTAFILTGALRGAGDMRFPLYARMLSSIMVRVSLAFLFLEVLKLGLIGARLAMGMDAVLLAGLVWWRFKSGKWKTTWRVTPTSKLEIKESPAAIPVSVLDSTD